MRRLLYIVMLPAMLFLSSCEFYSYPSKPIERSDLFGRYIGDFGETDVNFFDLFEDSSYISYYKIEDGHLYVDTGLWRFVQRRDKRSIDYWLDMYDFHPGHSSSDSVLREDDGSGFKSKGDPRIRRFDLTKSSHEIAVEYSFRKQQYYIKKTDNNKP